MGMCGVWVCERSVCGVWLDAGFDLSDKVDCYGAIGWIWSTRAIGNKGFEMLKQATRDLKADEIDDWTKIPAKRMRHRPRIVAYDEDGGEITGNNILGLENEVILDKDHKRILKALEAKEFNFNYVAEHNLFHTHTTALAQVHKELSLKGPYITATSGSTLCNCFIRAMAGGGFGVFRFGQGTLEHQLWDHSGKTTRCTYNQAMPPHKVIPKMGGEWISENKCYEFEHHQDLTKCVDLLGNKRPLKLIDDRYYQLHINGRGMVIRCKCEAEETPADCEGWERVKGYYKKILSRLEEVNEDSILHEVDQLVRYIKRKRHPVSYAKHDPDGWSYAVSSEAKRFLVYKVGARNAELYMGTANANPWQQVCDPFMPEDLEGRRWNADSARLAAQCANKPGPHPSWDMILKHTGQSLDEPLLNNAEMQKYGICTGQDYLRAWIACLIRYPKSPLPYLFFVGPENSGKSSVHEALRKCIEEGVVHGGTAMTSASGFNGEFSGKVLATIDETDLSKAEGLSSKIKFWTNATHIPIHIKGQQPFDAENTMHFMQSGNSVEVCVIPYGDTRMMVFWVPPFPGIEVPKEVLMERCLEELPNFLYTLGTLQLPPLTERTRLPVISTEIKTEIMQSGEPTSIEFIKVTYHDVPGYTVKVSEAYDAYKKWCVSENKKPVAPNDFKLQVGLKYPVYQGPRGRAFSIGNISLNANAPPKEAFSMKGCEGRHERVSDDGI